MWRAYDYLKEGDKEKASKAFQKALERNPGNVLAALEGGLLLAEAGDYGEAYSSLVIASKGDPDYQRLLAELLVALEKGEGASEKIVAIGALREGLRSQSLGDFTAAREALEQAVLHDPELTEAHTSLAFLLVSQKQYDAAEKVLDRYLAHANPGVAGAYGLLAVIDIARDDEMAAKASVAKAKSIDAAYCAQFGPFFDALMARSSFDEVQTELARLKTEGTDLQLLMGDLIENFFFQNE
jgi:tetratricopeptide (TPR) repeat protein